MPEGENRTIAYIDGFNLYFGLKEASFQRYYWLNIQSLIESFMDKNQKLVSINYFTSKITGDYHKRARQEKYIEALKTLDKVKIIEGKYIRSHKECYLYKPETNQCGGYYEEISEKMTDVNIAITMVTDAINNLYDSAILVSGDMDLYPALKYIRENIPAKKVSVFFPPKRRNNDLANVAAGSLIISRKFLKDHQFGHIRNRYGEEIIKPEEWV